MTDFKTLDTTDWEIGIIIPQKAIEIPEHNISFHCDDGVEVLRLTKDGAIIYGELVTDVNKIYERFCAWMSLMENKK